LVQIQIRFSTDFKTERNLRVPDNIKSKQKLYRKFSPFGCVKGSKFGISR